MYKYTYKIYMHGMHMHSQTNTWYDKRTNIVLFREMLILEKFSNFGDESI